VPLARICAGGGEQSPPYRDEFVAIILLEGVRLGSNLDLAVRIRRSLPSNES
jgi:hypothetical protein